MGRWNVIGSSVLGLALTSLAMASACSSSKTPAGTPEDEGVGGSSQNAGGTQVVDASRPDSTVTDSGSGTGGREASISVPGAGGSNAVGGSDSGTAAEASTGAGGSSSVPADASIADAIADVLTVPPYSASDGAAPGVLCTFDYASGDASGDASTPACAVWAASNYNDDGTSSPVQDDVIPNNPTPGALQFVTKFGNRDAVRFRADFDPARDWSALTALHAYVKVVNPGDAKSIELIVRTGEPNGGDQVQNSYDIGTFPIGQFKELTLPMSAVQNKKQINRMGIQVTPKGGDAGAGDAGLREATVVIDYFWIE